jgi:hypothetical protein
MGHSKRIIEQKIKMKRIKITNPSRFYTDLEYQKGDSGRQRLLVLSSVATQVAYPCRPPASSAYYSSSAVA